MLAAASPVLAQAPDEPEVRTGSSATPEASAPATAPAIAIDQLTLDDDLIAATGLRPIGNRRVEALVSTGTDATHQGRLRATDSLGGVAIELVGNVVASDVLRDQSDATARIEHASERDRLRVTGGYTSGHVAAPVQSFTTDDRALTYGAAWTAWRATGRYELEARGAQTRVADATDARALDLDTSSLAAHAGFTSRRLQLLGFGHELATGIDVVQASGTALDTDEDPEMLTHMQVVTLTRRGHHRFLSAYLHDTIRVIETLDISTGFVFEHWRWLTSLTPLALHDEVQMDTDAPDEISQLIIGPRFGAVYHLGPALALTAGAFRELRTPTFQQLMRPVQNGSVLTVAGDGLTAETVTGAEAGPVLATGTLDARALVYWHEVDAPIAPVTVDDSLRTLANLGHARETGVEAAVSVRLAAPWLAGIGYTFANAEVTRAADHPELVGKQLPQTPRHHATALLAYDRPRIVTLTGRLHYIDRRFEDDRNTIALRPATIVDAMAARKLTHGLAGFVSVDNVLDRRYVANLAGVDTVGAPRLVQVGVRLDSARW